LLLHEQENKHRVPSYGKPVHSSNIENGANFDSLESQNTKCFQIFEKNKSNCTEYVCQNSKPQFRVSRMKMCSSCRRAKYCSKLCQVYDWRSGRHKMECQFLWFTFLRIKQVKFNLFILGIFFYGKIYSCFSCGV